jgi:hydrogenase maturation protease
MSPRAPLLVLAVGNPSRGDDAIGALLAERLSDWLNGLGSPWQDQVEVICDMQLMVEHVLDLSGRQRILFIDAAAQGDTPVSCLPLTPNHGAPTTSHQCSPSQLLALHQQVLHSPAPPASLLCVVGHQFELGSKLSGTVHAAQDVAWRQLMYWISAPHSGATMITTQTIDLVQNSWALVLPIAPQAAELFYNNLFTRDPSLKALFKGDMTQQGAKLMQMIGAAVGQLGDLGKLVPVLQSLGQRHGGYGVQDAHYATVGAALLDTLSQGLGEAFTAEVRQAWTDVYGVMADVMIQATPH